MGAVLLAITDLGGRHVNPTLLVLNSFAAATLLVAGAAKLAVPHPLRRALRELTSRPVPVAAIRGFAAVEIVVAFALLLPVFAVGLGVLGAVFVAAGLAGHLRRSSVPCGCLGGGNHALGLRNALVGVAFLGVAVVDVASGPVLSRAAPLVAAAATILLCFWTHRLLMRRLLLRRSV